jgi:D-methionine transport system ATP-binding protein
VSKTFKSHGHTVEACKDVTLEVHPGEIYGVIGHSGAGKSTLVRLINQLETTTSGKLHVLNQDVGVLKERDLKNLRAQIGMIFQQFNLFSAKKVFKNVEYPLKLAKIAKDERLLRVQELLKFVGLESKANAYPAKLSGGQKQRVAIARALATNPKILLADEATSALDPETTLDVLRLLKRINRELGITIVLITHTMSVVRLICDKVAVMDSGEVVEIGDTQQIFKNPKHPTTRNFINTLHILETGDLEAAGLGGEDE